MLARLITSLNWTIGSVALAFALGGPYIMDSLAGRANEAAAKQMVRQIIDGEGGYWALHKRYLEFTSFDAPQLLPRLNVRLDQDSSEYFFEAYYDTDGNFVIRALSKPEVLRQTSGGMPVLDTARIYQHVIPPSARSVNEGTSGWVRLPASKPGILARFLN